MSLPILNIKMRLNAMEYLLRPTLPKVISSTQCRRWLGQRRKNRSKLSPTLASKKMEHEINFPGVVAEVMLHSCAMQLR